MAQNDPFEVPQQLRDLAERNIEQASAAYSQFMDAMANAMKAWSAHTPANAMTSGFRDIQETAVRYAKDNADAAFALARELANANDIQSVLMLQARYAQTQVQSYARQAEQLGRLMTRTP